MAIMGVVLLAVMSLSSFFVCGGVLPIDGLPVPECADTEVSTNIPIRVDLDRMDKMRFVVELSASLTNDLEVLIGCDSDTNGVLAVEESRLAFGYDCGRWFVRNGEHVETEEICDGAMTRRELSVRYKDFAPDWNLVKVVRRGFGSIGESVSLVNEAKRFSIFVR